MLLLSFPFLLTSLAVNEKHCQVPILLLKGSVLRSVALNVLSQASDCDLHEGRSYLCYLLNVLPF